METLPKNVINNIFLYLSHPTADIVKEETIFIFMALRHSDSYTTRACGPYMCGCTDVWDPAGRFRPRKYDIGLDGRRHHDLELNLCDRGQYTVSYLHGGHSIYNQRLNIQIDWHIKDNEIKWPGDTSDEDSDSDTDSDTD
jgi:hypothetical protein